MAADRNGLKWHVVADCAPPNYVYNLAHGDVLIVQANTPAQVTQAVARVEASVHTQKLMQPSPLQSDPWAEAAAKLPHAQPTPAINMASLEASVEARILAKIQKSEDAPMEVEVESRIAALESQMTKVQQEQQMQQQQTHMLQHKVENLGKQISHNGSQVREHIDAQMKSQMERIEELLAKRPRQE